MVFLYKFISFNLALVFDNGFAVSEAFIDQIIANAAKYTCLPLCADANRLRLGVEQG